MTSCPPRSRMAPLSARSSVFTPVSGLADPRIVALWPELDPPPLTSYTPSIASPFLADVDCTSTIAPANHRMTQPPPNLLPHPPYLPDVCGCTWHHWIHAQSWCIFNDPFKGGRDRSKPQKKKASVCIMGLLLSVFLACGFSCLLRTLLSCLYYYYYSGNPSVRFTRRCLILHVLLFSIGWCPYSFSAVFYLWLQYSIAYCIITEKKLYIMGLMDCTIYP